MSETQSTSKQRTRSPSYPAITLEDALSKAAIIWSKANRHSASVETIAGWWGYDTKSSYSISAVAALKKFALVEESGRNENRTIKLSDLGIRLVYSPDKSSEAYWKDVRTSALSPSIHEELWERYSGSLPDDGVIRRYLVVDRKFNEGYVDSFINQFKQTLSFSKVYGTDILNDKVIEPQTREPILSPGGTKSLSVVQDHRGTSALSPVPESPSDAISLPLENGRALRIPVPMTEEDFELMIATLNLWKRRIVRPSESIPGNSYNSGSSSIESGE